MKIFVSCHSRLVDLDDSLYTQIQTGSSLSGFRLDCVHDDDNADNISSLNDTFCDLTAFYYSAHHLIDSDDGYYGIVQDKRFLVNNYSYMDVNQSYPIAINEKDLGLFREYLRYDDSDFRFCDMICARVDRMYQARNNLYDNWCLFHDKEFVLQSRDIISKRFPEYLPAFEEVFFGKPQFYLWHNIFFCNGSIYRK